MGCVLVDVARPRKCCVMVRVYAMRPGNGGGVGNLGKPESITYRLHYSGDGTMYLPSLRNQGSVDASPQDISCELYEPSREISVIAAQRPGQNSVSSRSVLFQSTPS